MRRAIIGNTQKIYMLRRMPEWRTAAGRAFYQIWQIMPRISGETKSIILDLFATVESQWNSSSG